ncbi:MAG TPA: Ig-like domain-containing protein [Patescibacteria group bacterium]|nr:Ig-like domain-containing protein [Patescibacteria group bacterium]
MALQLRRGETRSFGKMVAASFIVMAVAVQGFVLLGTHQLAFAVDSISLGAPTLLSPANGAAVGGASVTNQWSAVTGAVKYEYQSFNSANTNTTPRFDATYSVTSKTATNVAEGTVFYWRVRAINADNTPGAWSELWKIVIDSSVPEAPLDLSWKTSDGQTIADSGITNAYAGTASWQDATPSKVNHYIYKYWNDITSNPYKTGSEYTTTTGGMSVSGEFNQGEGVHHFCIAAVSIAGNPSVCTPFTITYDRTAPTAAFTFSNNNGVALTNGDVVVTLTTNEPAQTPTDWTRVDNTHFIRTYSHNGNYQVVVTDVAGNASVAQQFEVKRIDRNAPTIDGVNDGAYVTGSVSLSIFDPKYEGYDGFDAAHGLTVDGVAVVTTGGSNKTFLYTVSGEGHHVVTATDKAGNATTLSFTIDTTAPTIANVHVDHTPTSSGQLVVGGTVSDTNLKDYNLRIYQSDKSTLVSPWMGSVSVSNVDDGILGTFDISHLVDGQYWVRVWADDLAGNSTGHSPQIFVPFTIDRTAPSIMITNFTRSSDGTYTITGTTDDPSDVIVTIDNQAPLSATPSGGVWSVKTGVLVDGKHTVSAASTDAVGNGSTDSETYTSASGNSTVEKFAGIIAAALPVRFSATTPLTAGGSVKPVTGDQSVLGDQTTTPGGGEASSSSDNKNDDEAVKGASTTRDQGSAPSFVGLVWYWWLVVLAAVFGLWRLIVVRRRKNAE